MFLEAKLQMYFHWIPTPTVMMKFEGKTVWLLLLTDLGRIVILCLQWACLAPSPLQSSRWARIHLLVLCLSEWKMLRWVSSLLSRCSLGSSHTYLLYLHVKNGFYRLLMLRKNWIFGSALTGLVARANLLSASVVRGTSLPLLC